MIQDLRTSSFRFFFYVPLVDAILMLTIDATQFTCMHPVVETAHHNSQATEMSVTENRHIGRIAPYKTHTMKVLFMPYLMLTSHAV